MANQQMLPGLAPDYLGTPRRSLCQRLPCAELLRDCGRFSLKVDPLLDLNSFYLFFDRSTSPLLTGAVGYA